MDPGGIVFFVLCVGGSLLYSVHVRHTTVAELAQSDLLGKILVLLLLPQLAAMALTANITLTAIQILYNVSLINNSTPV